MEKAVVETDLMSHCLRQSICRLIHTRTYILIFDSRGRHFATSVIKKKLYIRNDGPYEDRSEERTQTKAN